MFALDECTFELVLGHIPLSTFYKPNAQQLLNQRPIGCMKAIEKVFRCSTILYLVGIAGIVGIDDIENSFPADLNLCTNS